MSKEEWCFEKKIFVLILGMMEEVVKDIVSAYAPEKFILKNGIGKG